MVGKGSKGTSACSALGWNSGVPGDPYKTTLQAWKYTLTVTY